MNKSLEPGPSQYQKIDLYYSSDDDVAVEPATLVEPPAKKPKVAEHTDESKRIISGFFNAHDTKSNPYPKLREYFFLDTPNYETLIKDTFYKIYKFSSYKRYDIEYSLLSIPDNNKYSFLSIPIPDLWSESTDEKWIQELLAFVESNEIQSPRALKFLILCACFLGAIEMYKGKEEEKFLLSFTKKLHEIVTTEIFPGDQLLVFFEENGFTNLFDNVQTCAPAPPCIFNNLEICAAITVSNLQYSIINVLHFIAIVSCRGFEHRSEFSIQLPEVFFSEKYIQAIQQFSKLHMEAFYKNATNIKSFEVNAMLATLTNLKIYFFDCGQTAITQDFIDLCNDKITKDVFDENELGLHRFVHFEGDDESDEFEFDTECHKNHTFKLTYNRPFVYFIKYYEVTQIKLAQFKKMIGLLYDFNKIRNKQRIRLGTYKEESEGVINSMQAKMVALLEKKTKSSITLNDIKKLKSIYECLLIILAQIDPTKEYVKDDFLVLQQQHSFVIEKLNLFNEEISDDSSDMNPLGFIQLFEALMQTEPINDSQ